MQRQIAVLIGCALVGVLAANAASAVEAKRHKRYVRVQTATKVKNLADPSQAAQDPAKGQAAAQQTQVGATASAQLAPADAGAAQAGQPAGQPGLAAATPAPAAAAPLQANPPLPGFLAALFQPRSAAVQQLPPPAASPVAEASEAGGTTVVAANTPMRQLVARHAAANGVPFSLAHAVIMIESKYTARVAHAGNYGLMQIRAETARGLGFTGSAAGLLDPETNLRFGMKYLAMAYKLARGDTCGTVMRYQSGVATTHMNAANRAYCARARGFMAHM